MCTIKRMLLAVTLGLCAEIVQANTLSPFTTDGCSMWMDGTPAQPNLWRHCCVAHDKAYWLGGSEAERKAADDEIKACVEAAQGKAMADYMYTHIRWGGSPFWFSLYRWGYGWNYWDLWQARGYKTPTPEEQEQIDQLLPAADALIAEDARIHAPKTPNVSAEYQAEEQQKNTTLAPQSQSQASENKADSQ